MSEMVLINLGVVLIMMGIFILVFWGITRSVRDREEKTNVKTGGVIMIGPVPIVFGSDKRSALIAIILTIVLMILAIIVLK